MAAITLAFFLLKEFARNDNNQKTDNNILYGEPNGVGSQHQGQWMWPQ
jgi:hypothetical protein